MKRKCCTGDLLQEPIFFFQVYLCVNLSNIRAYSLPSSSTNHYEHDGAKKSCNRCTIDRSNAHKSKSKV